MLKIGPKTQTKIIRYFTKNTARAKYNRNMDAALFSSLGAIAGGIASCQNLNTCNFILTGLLGANFFRCMGKGLKHLVEIQPLRKRALHIKKAAKLNKKV